MDTLERRDVAGSDSPDAPAPRRKERHPIRTVVLLLCAALLVPVGWSYASALRAPGSAPISARTVEWIKDHHGTGVVLWAEKVWYTWHTAPVGGTPQDGIPVAGASVRGATMPGSRHPQGPQLPPHLPAPAPVSPIAANPLPSEGHWQAVGRSVHGLPAVRVTYLRPDTVHTSLLAGVMWIDQKLARTRLVAGTQVPGSGSWPYGAQVPPSMDAQLAATFNSGFLLKDSGGGFYLDGRTAAPLVPGEASIVIYKDGTVNVGTWGRDVSMTPDVKAVRQNLWLLVDHGKLTPRLTGDPSAAWGITVGGNVLVWRSGIGITKDGALVYADGPYLSATSLANVLKHAGAVRAMELDINTDWTNAYYYSAGSGPTGLAAHPLLNDQFRPPSRYLVPDERDFFMVTVRGR